MIVFGVFQISIVLCRRNDDWPLRFLSRWEAYNEEWGLYGIFFKTFFQIQNFLPRVSFAASQVDGRSKQQDTPRIVVAIEPRLRLKNHFHSEILNSQILLRPRNVQYPASTPPKRSRLDRLRKTQDRIETFERLEVQQWRSKRLELASNFGSHC